jgi:hypothetical protein
MVFPPVQSSTPRTDPYTRAAMVAAERRRLWGYLLLGMAASMVVAGLGYAIVRAFKPASAPRVVVPAPAPPSIALEPPAPPELAEPSADAAKKLPKRAGKKLPKSSPIHREWAAAQLAYDELVKAKPCELASMALICSRFPKLREDVEKFREDMEVTGVGTEADLLGRIRSMADNMAKQKKAP